MILEWLPRLIYMVSTALFVIGLKRLGSPATARDGNRLAAGAMAVAIVVTLINPEIHFQWIALGAVLGAAVGWVLAKRVEMTDMPQLVALFNGFGGLASTCVGVGDYYQRAVVQGASLDLDYAITIGLSILIGTVTFTGSLVAYGKLQGIVSGNPVSWPGRVITSVVVALAALGSVVWLGMVPDAPMAVALMVASALLLGVMLVMPIGGADMPVVVALLNSYSGMAAAATGFVLKNDLLIVAGALVGVSGLILTRIMCEAMNRSLANVIFGAFGGDGGSTGGGEGVDGVMRAMTVDDVAIQLVYAEKVIIVPGYGMAVAQAQHVVRELTDLLEAQGVSVKFAIHPVAGRMPGHMNVLLAESNVPYGSLYELEPINPEFPTTDVAMVIGANDVVNPEARDNPNSSIYGMPILEVDKARSAVVLKRGRGRGFAGLVNPLFFAEKTGFLFGDAKDTLTQLVQAVKEQS